MKWRAPTTIWSICIISEWAEKKTKNHASESVDLQDIPRIFIQHIRVLLVPLSRSWIMIYGIRMFSCQVWVNKSQFIDFKRIQYEDSNAIIKCTFYNVDRHFDRHNDINKLIIFFLFSFLIEFSAIRSCMWNTWFCGQL